MATPSKKLREERNKIIIDTDGGLDDAMAIILLLAADANKEIEILGITCVAGNTDVEHVSINVLSILREANRLDIPVYVGAAKPLIPSNSQDNSMPFYGYDGFGDANLPNKPDPSLVQKENAIECLNRIMSQYEGQITVVCLGPLTNIALALRTYSKFAQIVNKIFIMGGNYKGVGNTTSAAEFNFHSDPEAAQIVLSSIQCPIIIVPWEASVEVHLTMEWRFSVLGNVHSPLINLLNFLEKNLLEKKKRKPEMWGASDSLICAVLLRPSIVNKSLRCHLSVELHGERTRGQALVDHLGKNEQNVEIIENINVSEFKELLLWAARKTARSDGCQKMKPLQN